jgi:hypothetical protein
LGSIELRGMALIAFIWADGGVHALRSLRVAMLRTCAEIGPGWPTKTS